MKNESLYHKTIGILVKAYLNDTLEHGNCMACAVGNIIAANLGIKVINDADNCIYTDGKGHEAIWEGDFDFEYNAVRFLTFKTIEDSIPKKDGLIYNNDPLVLKQVEATGYTFRQLAILEAAFESTSTGYAKRNMHEGLMAVVEALGEIHEVEKETTEQTKLMFVKN